MSTSSDIRLAELNSFDPATRAAALQYLAANVPAAPLLDPPHVNMHGHSFFSYNGYDASPSRVAWEGVRQGWLAAGLCDFDVLDGMDEFLAAGDTLGLRVSVALESRVFFSEYDQQVINSPGEPGVYYFMGAGFVRPPAAGSPAAAQLAALRQGADARNRDVVARVNPVLAPATLDYAADVLPLTPAGNATERHLCAAYANAAQRLYPDTKLRAAFWADKLGLPADKAAALVADPMTLNDTIRSKFMKLGGPGYVAPTPATFPRLDDVIALIQACDAVPMAAWLDGTTPGEADLKAQLECLRAKGVAAINIIPDRNWNLKNADERALKVRKFHECVAIADALQLPVHVGTELNKYGQRWVDDFRAEAMLPVAATCIRGALVLVGHTRLLRYAGVGYCSAAAASEFPTLTARNAFFTALGQLPVPSAAQRAQLAASPQAVNYATLRDAVKKGGW